MKIRFGGILALVLPGLIAAGAASARVWDATPASMAQDYSMIQDNRPGSKLVMVFWLSPPMLDNKEMGNLLESNLVIGVLDAHVTADSKVTFVDASQPVITDAQGNILQLKKDADIAPNLSSGLQTMEATFRQALGAIGQGYQWFVFDSPGVHACAPNSGFSLQFAGKTYTYNTPIPGCPKN